MNKDKKAILITAALLLVLCLGAVLGYQKFAPRGVAGEKEITVKVVHADAGEKEFTYQTDEEFLGAVLEAEGLAEGEEGPYGLYIISVDGETADEYKNAGNIVHADGTPVRRSGGDAVSAEY